MYQYKDNPGGHRGSKFTEATVVSTRKLHFNIELQ